jgi:hypothetical protein
MRLRGPWVPWMTVVICAVLFHQPWPPGYQPPPSLHTALTPRSAWVPPQQQLPTQQRPQPPVERPALPPGS